MRIAAVAHDPGGANAVIAVVLALRRAGVTVDLHTKGPATRRARELGAEAQPVGADHRTIAAALDADLLVAGTSATDTFEVDATGAFAARGLPTVAVLDYPANFAARFRRGEPAAPTWPDVITALDAGSAAAMAADGIPARLIRVTGQPYLAALLRRRVGRRCAAGSGRRILFASQPGTEEVQALEWVASEVRALGPDALLTVRFHPRQTDRAPSLRCLEQAGVAATIDDETPTLRVLEDHDVVLGVTSTILVEAALLGRRAASVLVPGVPDALACLRQVLGPPLRSPAALDEFLRAPAMRPLNTPFLAAQWDADLRVAALCLTLAIVAREAA